MWIVEALSDVPLQSIQIVQENQPRLSNASICLDCGACDATGVRGTEIANKVCDLVRSHPCRHIFVGHAFDIRLSSDDAGCDSVDGNPCPSEFLSHKIGEQRDACL